MITLNDMMSANFRASTGNAYEILLAILSSKPHFVVNKEAVQRLHEGRVDHWPDRFNYTVNNLITYHAIPLSLVLIGPSSLRATLPPVMIQEAYPVAQLIRSKKPYNSGRPATIYDWRNTTTAEWDHLKAKTLLTDEIMRKDVGIHVWAATKTINVDWYFAVREDVFLSKMELAYKRYTKLSNYKETAATISAKYRPKYEKEVWIPRQTWFDTQLTDAQRKQMM